MRRFLSFLLPVLLLTACGHTPPQDKVLLAKADSLMGTNPPVALMALRQIRNVRQLSSPDHAWYALLMSRALDKCNIHVQSDSLIRIATHYYGEDNPVCAGYAWFYMARVDEHRGNAEGRATSLLKAQQYALQSRDYALRGLIYGDKAREFQEQWQLDSSLFYFHQAYYSFKQGISRRNEVVNLLSIGYTHYLKREFDSALVYYQYAGKQAVFLQDTLVRSSINRETGLTFFYKKNYSQALHYFRLASEVSDAFDYSKWFDIAMTYLQINEPDSARFYLLKCKDPHEMAPDYYRLWEILYEKKGNLPLALHYANKVSIAKDSLNRLALKESFAGLEKKYNYQRMVAENSKLAAANQQKMNLLLMVLVALLFILSFFLLFYLNRKKKELAQQQVIINHQKERTQLMEKQQHLQNVLQHKIDTFRQNVLAGLQLPEQQTEDACVPGLNQPQLEEVLSNIEACYNDIGVKLQTRFPILTQHEIHILMLIQVHFTSSQIAGVLGTSENAINVTRSTIRKKLNLSNKINLVTFLSHVCTDQGEEKV
ncbi:LuxR C-terminal-related transcriptional regulator [Microbacter margulisiae]|uniref:DNA-binding CsgD family transcriptional regulator n=1 Tax=Microbacter margulisiae TaxID=1350067 RepID=A0A7W5H3G2_9PORP|nr:LuxR C-terminal-related transcriptional regulator [Microbacter margulisiae]MBB3188357.1 DNA-binding CsgD family transcriptional regulator [Microbacter margulisiae]